MKLAVTPSSAVGARPLWLFATLWSLRKYPTVRREWTWERKFSAIRAAGFDGVFSPPIPAIAERGTLRYLAVPELGNAAPAYGLSWGPKHGRSINWINYIEWSPTLRRYRMWYNAGDYRRPCYAESADGMTWTKPVLNLSGTNFDGSGSKSNNIIDLGYAPKDPATTSDANEEQSLNPLPTQPRKIQFPIRPRPKIGFLP